MAKVVLPALSAEASGKLGSIVFMKRYGQAIARIRTKPANPRTPSQVWVREQLAKLSQAYKGSGSYVLEDANGKYVMLKKRVGMDYVEVRFDVLSDTERAMWEDYAMKTGKPRQFGRLAFTGMNIKRLSMGQDPTRTP